MDNKTIQWFGENNKLGHDIWNRKYRYKGESLDGWFDRVSGGDVALRKLIEEKNSCLAAESLLIEELKKAAISTIAFLMVMFPIRCLALWILRKH